MDGIFYWIFGVGSSRPNDNPFVFYNFYGSNCTGGEGVSGKRVEARSRDAWRRISYPRFPKNHGSWGTSGRYRGLSAWI
jgi:hypothetical protein